MTSMLRSRRLIGIIVRSAWSLRRKTALVHIYRWQIRLTGVYHRKLPSTTLIRLIKFFNRLNRIPGGPQPPLGLISCTTQLRPRSSSLILHLRQMIHIGVTISTLLQSCLSFQRLNPILLFEYFFIFLMRIHIWLFMGKEVSYV